MLFVLINESIKGLYFPFLTSATRVGNFVKDKTSNLRFSALAIDIANAVFPVPGSPINNKIYPAASIFTADSFYSY